VAACPAEPAPLDRAAARREVSRMPPLIDPFARPITYLRVSVTDRCDLRCVYCMAEDMTFLPRAEILSLEELERLCDAFIAAGVRKLLPRRRIHLRRQGQRGWRSRLK